MVIPQEYIVQKFYQYAGYPKFKKFSNTYMAGCPICREGKSWNKKRRCIYLVDDNKICCHNCGWYGDTVKWVQEVSGLTFVEIINESKNYEILPLEALADDQRSDIQKPIKVERLPLESIDLFDKMQINYYNNNRTVNDALLLLEKRRMINAINRPKSLFLSLNDKVHKNRIIIPFYNEENEVIFYQSRIIYDKDLRLYPKYLSKINGEKSLYNINNINADLEYIFVFEGPIDAFFVRNGTAISGIQENSHTMFSALQENQLNSFKFHKRIWVLDSQYNDRASRNKTEKLIQNGETVFIWPENDGKKYKDINDLVIDKKIDSVDPSYFVENSYSGIKAKLLLSVISRN